MVSHSQAQAWAASLAALQPRQASSASPRLASAPRQASRAGGRPNSTPRQGCASWRTTAPVTTAMATPRPGGGAVQLHPQASRTSPRPSWRSTPRKGWRASTPLQCLPAAVPVATALPALCSDAGAAHLRARACSASKCVAPTGLGTEAGESRRKLTELDPEAGVGKLASAPLLRDNGSSDDARGCSPPGEGGWSAAPAGGSCIAPAELALNSGKGVAGKDASEQPAVGSSGGNSASRTSPGCWS